MPITKQDIQGFGNTLKATLDEWGKQIQYTKDLEKVKKIQDQISSIKDFTTDSSGNPLGYEDLSKKIFALNGELSGIQTPELMKLAGTNVADFVKMNVSGVTQGTQNKFDIGVENIQNPDDAKSMNELTSSLPFGMYKVKGITPDKNYASKIIEEPIIGEDGKIDPNYSNQFALITTTRGTVKKVFLNKIARNKLTAGETIKENELNRQNKIEVAATPNTNYNYSSITSNDRTYRQVSFYDPTTGNTINGSFSGGRYYDQYGKPMQNIDKYIAISEGNPISGVTEDFQKRKDEETIAKVWKDRFTDDEQTLINIKIKNGTLFKSDLWKRLSPDQQALAKRTWLLGYKDKE